MDRREEKRAGEGQVLLPKYVLVVCANQCREEEPPQHRREVDAVLRIEALEGRHCYRYVNKYAGR